MSTMAVLSGGDRLKRESWRAFVDPASTLGDLCLVVGGQMVLLLEIERGASDTRPTDDVDVVIDLRVEPTGLTRVHAAARTSNS